MDPFDYFFMEEFIFPETGGVTGTRRVSCPHCAMEFELTVDEGNAADTFRCGNCQNLFIVNWIEGTVSTSDVTE